MPNSPMMFYDPVTEKYRFFVKDSEFHRTCEVDDLKERLANRFLELRKRTNFSPDQVIYFSQLFHEEIGRGN